MAISALGYLGIRSGQIDDWSDFASKLLGMQQVDRAGKTLAFRMDDRKQRLIVSDETGDTLSFIGWEVAEKSDLDQYATRLEAEGVVVEYGNAELLDRRFVSELIHFYDPDGNRVELFYKPMLTTDPFEPGRSISGFNTGVLGMGHCVLNVKDADKMLGFYRDLLLFEVSDFGLSPYPMYFFHVNKRHHSLALLGTGKSGFHHFMVEYKHLDDVGQGYDIAQLEEGRIAYTLGRHTNDYMTSFYAHTPSGFFVENGWGGRLIEPATWEPHETFDGPSFWGHERLYLPDDQRAVMRDMRMDAASRGVRSPNLIDCPWLYGKLGSK
jgi:2,3-dihydroxybiphenyl 1,2-dioxygenase|tara:strand:+ start:1321 stop:2292 length:972 start_codon:yes stop_codon:yes gene_type:complete